MKQTWFFPLLLTPIAASPVLAESTDINHNIFTQFAYAQSEQGGLAETDSLQMVVTAYLEEVNHGRHPHTQASFLERAASVTVGYAGLDADYPFIGSADGSASGVDIQYVTHTHWVVGGGYSRTEIKGLSEQRSKSLTLGRYLDDTSRALLSYATTRNEPALGSNSTTDSYGLEYKNVILHLSGSALTLDMKASYIDAEAGSSKRYSLQGEYHFTLASSVTAETQFTRGNGRSRQYTLGVNHFFTRFLALGAEYTRLNPAGQENTETTTLYTRLLF